MIGPSRKAFLATLNPSNSNEEKGASSLSSRLAIGTVACCCAGVAGKVDIVRVHDVDVVADALKVADAIWRA